jgi:hypothetical protein
MTVKELKKALRGVPDEIPVRVLVDSWESHMEDAWGAGYSKDKDPETGEVEKEFVINC